MRVTMPFQLPSEMVQKQKESLQKYADLIDPGRQLSEDLDKYIAGIISTLVETPENGGQGKGYVLG